MIEGLEFNSMRSDFLSVDDTINALLEEKS